jgi:hypothetical protein
MHAKGVDGAATRYLELRNEFQRKNLRAKKLQLREGPQDSPQSTESKISTLDKDTGNRALNVRIFHWLPRASITQTEKT